MAPKMSEHNMFITTARLPRTFVGDLPRRYFLTYGVPEGWTLYETNPMGNIVVCRETLTGDLGLRLDVDGLVICDSLTEKPSSTDLRFSSNPDMDW